MTLQEGNCNLKFQPSDSQNPKPLGLGGLWGPAAGIGIRNLLGIWEFAKVATAYMYKERWPLGAGIGIWNLGISSLQGALGGGIGIGNLGISSLQGVKQGALGAGIGIWNLGISSLQGRAGGRDWNLESGNFEFARNAGGRDWNWESGNFEFARS